MARLVVTITIVAALSLSLADQVGLGAQHDSGCRHPGYQVHLVSSSPLVMYLEGFLTADERAHLEQVGQGRFSDSAVVAASGEAAIHQVRTSQSTAVERDAVVRCIEQRALSLQGFDRLASQLEPMQLVRYGPQQRYHLHTDWFTDPTHAAAQQGGNRASSIFGYVKAHKLTGGGTHFPLLDVPRNERWCRFVDCDAEYDSGLTFRPIEGNAVYWDNMLEPGRGDERTLHAGLPVVSGDKIGINIWTREAPLPPNLRDTSL
ncbi:hypothetical protein CDD81_6143 [Ophiocordyceps australis]|uniref:Fe2OG dioxygenase domain-containing protein n=1 Tax=Ophiocordyceps australis TaxID=1399860 RepID=A0A2C5Y6F5_9HYPO|nr:hypothetical protein CDD81_6143 [Ophiocordyceps australis]